MAWAPHYTELLSKYLSVDFTVPSKELLIGLGAIELLAWLLLPDSAGWHPNVRV